MFLLALWFAKLELNMVMLWFLDILVDLSFNILYL